MTSVVIVGSGFTGFECARRLSRQLRKDNAPVDISIISPDGTRISWMGGRTDVTNADSTATDREQLALKSLRRGNYLVEVTRNGNAAGAIHGSLDLSVLGSKKTIWAPPEAMGWSASVVEAAVARASSSSPCEMSGRPQQASGASVTFNPAASRTRAPAMPTAGL